MAECDIYNTHFAQMGKKYSKGHIIYRIYKIVFNSAYLKDYKTHAKTEVKYDRSQE
jgi:hypothetical protein